MQSKGGYDEVTEVPEDVTPSGQYVVSTRTLSLLPPRLVNVCHFSFSLYILL